MIYKNYALVDVSFCSDNKNTIFVKSVNITGIKESCKIFSKEFKYQYPTIDGINDIEKSNNYVFGNCSNEQTTNELQHILKKIDILFTNGKIKTKFLKQFVDADIKVFDFSCLE